MSRKRPHTLDKVMAKVMMDSDRDIESFADEDSDSDNGEAGDTKTVCQHLMTWYSSEIHFQYILKVLFLLGQDQAVSIQH